MEGARVTEYHLNAPDEDYDHDLARLKDCFIGGGEGTFYFRMLDRIKHLEHIEWLDIGIGRDGGALLPFVAHCRRRGQSLAITGVDPDAEARAFEDDGVRWRLVRSPFQAWNPDMTFDVVNADHSAYYLENPLAGPHSLLAALKPGGLLLATCWSRDDTLRQIRGHLFPKAERDLVGEDLLAELQTLSMLERVEVTTFSTAIDMVAIGQDMCRLAATVRVISRGERISNMDEFASRLAALLSAYPPIAPRVNMAMCFRRRAAR